MATSAHISWCQEPNHESQSPTTKATSPSTNADSFNNDMSAEDKWMTAIKVKKIKPYPKPIKHPMNSTLTGTCEKRTCTGPTPKEILTIG